MNRHVSRNSVFASRCTTAIVLSLGLVPSLQAQPVETRVGTIELELGVPTEESAQRLFDSMDFQRACQAYLWALPAVGFEYVLREQRNELGAGNGDVVIYKGYRDVSRFLTPNVTTPYIIGFMDLAEAGPMMLEVPAGAIAGSAMDFWQRPLTDFGMTGPDQGKGGQYLLVGPGQEPPARLPADVRVVRSPTFGIGFFYRALDADPAKAAAMEKAIRTYVWKERNNPRPTKHIVPSAPQTKTLPRGMEYWEQLAAVVGREPVDDRDRFFVAMLRPLGIERGKEFGPDERQRRLLTEAAEVGELMAKANSFDKRFPGSRYRPDAHWDFVILADPAQDLADYSQLDERGAYFYEAVALSKGMVTKTPGVGQAYLGSYRDGNGHAFDGGKSYRLRVPPHPPAKQFWSVTVYDTETRGIVQNAQQIADRSSRQELVANADGSVDVYFGPTAPNGFEKNWIPTVPGRSWFTYFRLYAPLEPYFDRSWPLPDIELVH
ncbi:MAG: DUF1254 domain-containing protein [Thermoanaerobaculia bacterium]